MDTLFVIIGTVTVISVITPIFLVFLIPLAAFYLIAQHHFLIPYRELKRLDVTGRSPISAFFGESLNGVATIRAFSATTTFTNKLVELLDRQQQAYYLMSAAKSWLGLRLELVGTGVIAFACGCAVWEHDMMSTALFVGISSYSRFAGLAGLSISFALTVTQELNWSVRLASDLDTYMAAVQRIALFCRIKGGEGSKRRQLMDDALPLTWPFVGEIQFDQTKLRYRPELPLALDGIDLVIPGGSKVGVVGRVGSGKSTLMVALFRLAELESGKILIDGVDHRVIGLAKLRKSIALVPQKPILFSGTVKSNIDPFDDWSSETILETLTRVGLYEKGSTSNIINSVDDKVSEGGLNFSVGHRQLLMMARALLGGEKKIVIMDEATEGVDADTEARIKSVLRQEFANATCITVAHRSQTILDSDYVLVMEDGRAVEFDKPNVLLENKRGKFRAFVEAADAPKEE